MKATIQVEDPRGENISPMDEKTRTADCVLNVWMFNEWIHISEEGCDMDAEGVDVDLLALVQEFVADCENSAIRERNEKCDVMKRTEADEGIVLLSRLGATLRKCQAVTDAAHSRLVSFVASDDAVWNEVCDKKNKAEAARLKLAAAPAEEPSL